MVITDLKQSCPRCQGGGFQPGFSVLGVNQINYHGRCPTCQGRGFLLTELGEDLVNLLKPIIREVLEAERAQEENLRKALAHTKAVAVRKGEKEPEEKS